MKRIITAVLAAVSLVLDPTIRHWSDARWKFKIPGVSTAPLGGGFLLLKTRASEQVAVAGCRLTTCLGRVPSLRVGCQALHFQYTHLMGIECQLRHTNRQPRGDDADDLHPMRLISGVGFGFMWDRRGRNSLQGAREASRYLRNLVAQVPPVPPFGIGAVYTVHQLHGFQRVL